MRVASRFFRGGGKVDNRFLAPWIVGAVLLLAAFPDVLTGAYSFFYRDFGFFGYPLAFYNKHRLWAGSVPLWNPLSDCGLPYLAQWNTLVCYPLSLIYLVLPLPWSLNLYVLFHLMLAIGGMYRLALRWSGNHFAAEVAGIAYGWNGLVLQALMWPNNIAALGWMPWVVWAVERAWREGGWRRLAVAAGVGAAQMLSGAPEVILLTWVFIAGWWFAGTVKSPATVAQTLVRLTGVVIWVALLAAVQLLPFLDLLRHSQRGAGPGSQAWAMPPWGWVNLIVPQFHTTRSILGVQFQESQQWTASYYPGAAMLGLAGLAVVRGRRRVVWGLGLTFLVSLMMAMGREGLLWQVAHRLIPALAVVRYPVKYIVLGLFVLPLLGAMGVAWTQSKEQEPGQVCRALGWVGLGLGLAIGMIVLAAWRWPFPSDTPAATARNGAMRVGFTLGILGILAYRRGLTSGNSRRWAGVAVLFLVGLDGLTNQPRQNPTVRTVAYAPLPLEMSPRPVLGEGRAMVSPARKRFLDHAATADPLAYYTGNRRALFLNCNLPAGVPKVDGFYSLDVREEAEVQKLLYGERGPIPGRLLDFLGVTQISSSKELFGWQARAMSGPWITAGEAPVFAGPKETMKGLASDAFEPAREVYLPPQAASEVLAGRVKEARVVKVEAGPERVKAVVSTPRRALVVRAQTYYHWWEVSVDGERKHLWRANHAFQAVEIPPGRHTVQWVYRDRGFEVGAWVSGAAWTLLLGLGVIGCRGRLRKGKGVA